MLIGVLLASGSAVALVHDRPAVHQAPVRVLYNYGSG